jgi:hypothetical protein
VNWIRSVKIVLDMKYTSLSSICKEIVWNLISCLNKMYLLFRSNITTYTKQGSHSHHSHTSFTLHQSSSCGTIAIVIFLWPQRYGFHPLVNLLHSDFNRDQAYRVLYSHLCSLWEWCEWLPCLVYVVMLDLTVWLIDWLIEILCKVVNIPCVFRTRISSTIYWSYIFI